MCTVEKTLGIYQSFKLENEKDEEWKKIVSLRLKGKSGKIVGTS